MSFLMSGWVYVIFGSLAIAVGGFLTTKGWSEFNSYEARKSLITAAYKEWKENDSYLQDMENHKQSIDQFDQPILLPSLHENSIQSLITSHLLSESNKRDSKLVKTASNYLLNIKPLNDSIFKINFSVPSIGSKEERISMVSNFYCSPVFERAINHHKELGLILKSIVKAG